jgi:threonyl-tRNA synthetase
MEGNSVVNQGDYAALETLAKNVVKDKQKFERLEVSKENLLEMFAVSLGFVHAETGEHGPDTTPNLSSTTRSRRTSSRTRSPTVPRRLSTAAAR